ncbi:hypothetical protein STXM2123_4827 [Streptomyces sp. F-3]|nr:hypothetical protein STXM2123_4827 [Streptomyces sp. F-3]
MWVHGSVTSRRRTQETVCASCRGGLERARSMDAGGMR